MKNEPFSQVIDVNQNNSERSLNGMQRVPMHKQSDLVYDIPKGYVGHIVQDAVGEIEKHQKAGWEVVKDPNADISTDNSMSASRMGTVVKKVTNQDPNARSRYGVLMIKRADWDAEDRLEEQKRVDAQESGLKKTQENPMFNHGNQYTNKNGMIDKK